MNPLTSNMSTSNSLLPPPPVKWPYSAHEWAEKCNLFCTSLVSIVKLCCTMQFWLIIFDHTDREFLPVLWTFVISVSYYCRRKLFNPPCSFLVPVVLRDLYYSLFRSAAPRSIPCCSSPWVAICLFSFLLLSLFCKLYSCCSPSSLVNGQQLISLIISSPLTEGADHRNQLRFFKVE